MGETQLSNGIVASSSVSAMVGAWADFHDDLIAASTSPELSIASYQHSDAHPVINIRVDNVAGTQRRRQDQLRS
jgi:hypothetical protein